MALMRGTKIIAAFGLLGFVALLIAATYPNTFVTDPVGKFPKITPSTTANSKIVGTIDTDGTVYSSDALLFNHSGATSQVIVQGGTNGALWIGPGATNTSNTMRHAPGTAFLPIQAVARSDTFPGVGTNWEFNLGMDYNDPSSIYTLVQGTGDTFLLADGLAYSGQLEILNSGPISTPAILLDTISSQTGTNDDCNIVLQGITGKPTITLQIDGNQFNGILVGSLITLDAITGIITNSGVVDNSGTVGSIVSYGAGNRLVATNVATLVSNVTLTTINATDIHVSGKATFNQIIITNGFFSATNVWSGATNSVDMSINDQYFTTVTPCQISGIFNTSNSLSSQVTLTILNNSSTNITVTYGSAGFVDRDHVTAQTITNATVGIFWIKHTPAIGGHTNVVFNDF